MLPTSPQCQYSILSERLKKTTEFKNLYYSPNRGTHIRVYEMGSKICMKEMRNALKCSFGKPEGKRLHFAGLGMDGCRYDC
jgi:hypothetical protein